MKRLASGQRGFSLLEVLVAFAILSIALGVLLQIFATGMRNVGLSEEYSQAALYAESILAAYGREAPLAEGCVPALSMTAFPGAGQRPAPMPTDFQSRKKQGCGSITSASKSSGTRIARAIAR